MTVETPLLTALFAAAGAVLMAVIGLIASVHYRLGKLEMGQEALAQEDARTREMVVQENAHTREMVAQGDAHTREMVAQGDAHTRELIMQEIAALRDRSDAQHAETMGAIQRLTDAFLSHSHDTDGAIRFRIPPPSAAPSDQQEP